MEFLFGWGLYWQTCYQHTQLSLLATLSRYFDSIRSVYCQLRVNRIDMSTPHRFRYNTHLICMGCRYVKCMINKSRYNNYFSSSPGPFRESRSDALHLGAPPGISGGPAPSLLTHTNTSTNFNLLGHQTSSLSSLPSLSPRSDHSQFGFPTSVKVFLHNFCFLFGNIFLL